MRLLCHHTQTDSGNVAHMCNAGELHAFGLASPIAEPNCYALLKLHLERDCFPGKLFDVQLFGSLHHGLYVPGSSKINVDASCEGSTGSGYVLQVLTAYLQMRLWKDKDDSTWPMQHTVLVWHRSASRPWALVLSWEGVPVHVTCCNAAGVRVSNFMLRTLN